jgi:hypothetical protein
MSDFLMALSLIFLFGLLALTGSAARFLFYTIPFFCIIIGKSMEPLLFRNKRFFYALSIIFLLDTAYVINTFFIHKPFGKSSIMYSSSLRKKDDSTAYLDQYLNSVLTGLSSFDNLNHKNAYAKKVALTYQNKRPGKPAAVRLIYDPLSDITTFIWILHRRSFYEGWPLISYEGVRQLTSVPLTEKNGRTRYVYIQVITDSDTATTTAKAFDYVPNEREMFHETLRTKGISADSITNSLGEEKYRVYLFTQKEFSGIPQIVPVRGISSS